MGSRGNRRKNLFPVSVNKKMGFHKYENGGKKIENRTGRNGIFPSVFNLTYIRNNGGRTCPIWLCLQNLDDSASLQNILVMYY